MVWPNYQNLWLTALLLIGAVLLLVHGEYATCPTTKDGILFTKRDLQNPASYEEKACFGLSMCCAERNHLVTFSVSINVMCRAFCTSSQVDCSEAANRCRNVADVTEYYKSPDFLSCPYYQTPFDLITIEILCPAIDKCSAMKFIYETGLQHDSFENSLIVRKATNLRYDSEYEHQTVESSLLACMNTCKKIKAGWMEKVKKSSDSIRIITDCTACSSTHDCKQKLDIVPRCPTTKGRRLSTKEAIEALGSYEEKVCPSSDKCCAEKNSDGQLTIEVKCSASCLSPQVDCSQISNKCMNAMYVIRHASSEYVPCLSLTADVEWGDHIPTFLNLNMERVLCPRTEYCYAFRLEYAKDKDPDPYRDYIKLTSYSAAFAGCMKNCNEFLREYTSLITCKQCTTIDECRKILQYKEPV